MSAVMHSDQNRAFHYAVLASIVLHGLLLFGFAQRDPARRAAAPHPILARLVQPPAAEPAPASATPPVTPQTEPRKKPRAKPAASRPAVAPKAIVKAPPPLPAPVAEAVPPAPSTAVAAEEVPVTAPAVPAAPAAPPPPVMASIDPGPAPAAPTVEAVDPGSLAQFRLQLIGAARKYKRYPRVALDNNWEGDVVVRMVIGASGMISALSIRTSSGHEVLDQQALEMFKRAKPLVQIPAGLRGKEFAVELRAIYNLKDQDSG